MNQVEFTDHAVQRLFGRLQSVVSYAEIQTVLVNKPLKSGEQRVLIKTLSQIVKVQDPSAFNGKVEGNKVFALTSVQDNGVRVMTIALSY